MVEGFTKTSQRHRARNLQCKHLLIPILVEDLLPDVKKQIEASVVVWLGQRLDVIQIATQFFEELKPTVLVLQTMTLQ